MSLKERVEQVLHARGGLGSRALIGQVGQFDDCVVRVQADGSVVIRSGPGALVTRSSVARPPAEKTPELETCAQVLEDAGFYVQRAHDREGDCLKVTDEPTGSA